MTEQKQKNKRPNTMQRWSSTQTPKREKRAVAVGSNPTPRTLNLEMDESVKKGLLLNIETSFYASYSWKRYRFVDKHK
jgi:hypothetical protein